MTNDRQASNAHQEPQRVLGPEDLNFLLEAAGKLQRQASKMASSPQEDYPAASDLLRAVLPRIKIRMVNNAFKIEGNENLIDSQASFLSTLVVEDQETFRHPEDRKLSHRLKEFLIADKIIVPANSKEQKERFRALQEFVAELQKDLRDQKAVLPKRMAAGMERPPLKDKKFYRPSSPVSPVTKTNDKSGK